MISKYCDYDGCDEPICDNDAFLKSGLRFCQKHSDEAASLIRSENIPGLLAFWVRAQSHAEFEIGRQDGAQ